MSSQTDLDIVRDLIQIRSLVARYARACDRHSGADVSKLFVENGRLLKFEESSGKIIAEASGGVAIESSVNSLNSYTVTTHFIGQHDAAVEGDRASGETYCLAHHIYESDGVALDRVLSIRYLDEYLRVRGDWLFVERRLVIDWIEYRTMGSVSEAPYWARDVDTASLLRSQL